MTHPTSHFEYNKLACVLRVETVINDRKIMKCCCMFLSSIFLLADIPSYAEFHVRDRFATKRVRTVADRIN